jgi:hypothetical protein
MVENEIHKYLKIKLGSDVVDYKIKEFLLPKKETQKHKYDIIMYTYKAEIDLLLFYSYDKIFSQIKDNRVVYGLDFNIFSEKYNKKRILYQGERKCVNDTFYNDFNKYTSTIISILLYHNKNNYIIDHYRNHSYIERKYRILKNESVESYMKGWGKNIKQIYSHRFLLS